ncbi:hypothetical protein HK096_007929 [Nowakowskiella sp. JEL0078]|nr:hypothetical protein HK096_007929 [Nowakowskiella sp. JEL0078]
MATLYEIEETMATVSLLISSSISTSANFDSLLNTFQTAHKYPENSLPFKNGPLVVSAGEKLNSIIDLSSTVQASKEPIDVLNELMDEPLQNLVLEISTLENRVTFLENRRKLEIIEREKKRKISLDLLRSANASQQIISDSKKSKTIENFSISVQEPENSKIKSSNNEKEIESIVTSIRESYQEICEDFEYASLVFEQIGEYLT